MGRKYSRRQEYDIPEGYKKVGPFYEDRISEVRDMCRGMIKDMITNVCENDNCTTNKKTKNQKVTKKLKNIKYKKIKKGQNITKNLQNSNTNSKKRIKEPHKTNKKTNVDSMIHMFNVNNSNFVCKRGTPTKIDKKSKNPKKNQTEPI